MKIPYIFVIFGKLFIAEPVKAGAWIKVCKLKNV